ncbi:hypothetical protein [Streptomyces sp. NPDC048508]|uniref:hypothetical protein n=1 Tax=Streptomyces sp. NPDC048508 TaxID=3365561 RepID=UPI00371849CE
MTVQIAPMGGVILLVTLIVGYFVHKHTARQSPTGKGDPVATITCAGIVLTALVLIFGGGQPTPPTPAGDSAPSTAPQSPGP